MTMASRRPEYNPDRFNFTKNVVDYWSQKGDDPVAMVWNPPGAREPGDTDSFHFSHFSQRARQVAVGLRRLGIQKGEVLLLVSSKTPDWYEVVCGAILGGVAICLCSSALVSSEIALRAQKARASVFVGDAEQVRRFVAARKCRETHDAVRQIVQIGQSAPPAAPGVNVYRSFLAGINPQQVNVADFKTESGDVCLLYFTSGTTGQAKLVKHNQVSYPYGHIITGEHWLDLRPGQMLWNLSDQGWAKSMWAFFGAWSQGGTIFLDAHGSAFEPERTINLLHQQPITTFCAAPTIFRHLVTDASKKLFAEKPPKALEHCTSAGEHLGAHIVLEWYEMTDGLMIWDGFGQTETSILCGNYPLVPPRLGSMGKPLPGVPLCVLNDERQVAHPFEEGDIAVRVSDDGTGLFRGIFEGYIHDDGSVVRPTVTDKEGQSWYLTGDRAHCDEEGYFWYKGRGDDVIISAGHRIGPAEVESVLQAHPAIRESAVVAAPDEQRGSIVKAFIVLHDHPGDSTSTVRLKQDIREHCLHRKAAQYCPQKIEFVDLGFLPKTVSGKVIRKELRMLERL